MWTHELDKLRTSRNQTSLPFSAEGTDLKVQLGIAQKRAMDIECERDKAKERFRQLQSGQQRCQEAVSRVEDKTATLVTRLVKDRN